MMTLIIGDHRGDNDTSEHSHQRCENAKISFLDLILSKSHTHQRCYT